jgi:hypothetical protein
MNHWKDPANRGVFLLQRVVDDMNPRQARGNGLLRAAFLWNGSEPSDLSDRVGVAASKVIHTRFPKYARRVTARSGVLASAEAAVGCLDPHGHLIGLVEQTS